MSDKKVDTHWIETALIENGKLLLKNLPFKKGDEVEVMIVEKKQKKFKSGSLKGTVIEYDEPFEAATSNEDWEVLN